MVKHHSPGFLALVEDAKKRVREISAAELKHKLDDGEKFHLVDLRESEERAAGHLPRAQHLPKGIHRARY
jgi:rhodanese-related sulfurtransferase